MFIVIGKKLPGMALRVHLVGCCFKYAKPDEKLRFEFTTTSKSVKERLGIKE